MMGDMGGMMGGWMYTIMWVNLLFGLGLLALVMIGIIVGIRWLVKSSNPLGANRRPDRALEIIRERYARGEISREEFERMRQDLS